MTKWTEFNDMLTRGGRKTDFNRVYIQAGRDEACEIFTQYFKHNPEQVSCTCCGPDFSIHPADETEVEWNDLDVLVLDDKGGVLSAESLKGFFITITNGIFDQEIWCPNAEVAVPTLNGMAYMICSYDRDSWGDLEDIVTRLEMNPLTFEGVTIGNPEDLQISIERLTKIEAEERLDS